MSQGEEAITVTLLGWIGGDEIEQADEFFLRHICRCGGDTVFRILNRPILRHRLRCLDCDRVFGLHVEAPGVIRRMTEEELAEPAITVFRTDWGQA